ncbi:cupin domain-containing protein [Nocardioides abyssi]|uniref:Cupin domain-containing protein n=1 Tax=Nocardioides abyssi TaxID=3058370 RepID=A0ABT8EUG6_9ACTN|nr:cupin domain-containing protein [Nocardioides abyssi]MDN4161749.1 cupin domain-containing protein [Nocardioides abyssi]
MGDEVVVHEPGSGRSTWAMQSLFEHLLEPGQSSLLGVALVTQPPGVATPLHRHTREAEACYVLDGAVSYQAGDEVFELHGGCFIHLPRDVPHAFRIRGDRPARLLVITAPSGLLHLYDEVGMPATERRLPGDDGLSVEDEIARWMEIGPRYGLELLGPPIPE